MKQEIDKKGLSKSVTQIKSKLRNIMKDAYKKKLKIITVKLELHFTYISTIL